MNSRILVFAFAALSATACLKPVPEPDCLLDGTCECKKYSDCLEGKDCIDGKCVLVPDAGHPGDFGTSCSVDADCHSGPCLPKGPGNGGVCSQACNQDGGTSCPRSWDCKQNTAATGFVCVPPFKSLCLGCGSDSDCNATGDLCLELDGGHFCGRDCTTTLCSPGYSCRALSRDAGIAHQCVPDTNSCTCGPANVGLTRSCKNSVGIGTCFGVETCQANSTFGGCSARTASAEVCDGIDNDCNGLTDHSDPALAVPNLPGFPNCVKGLTCRGLWNCTAVPDGGAAFSCSAPDPIDEACNGLDDNCNGQTDEGLLDVNGKYFTVRACGSCNTDCLATVSNLALDAGTPADIVSCVQRSGNYVCAPKKCAPGFYPSPASAPQTCEKTASPQCRPCSTAADCAVPGDQCLTIGTDPGKFCAQSCDISNEYPTCTGIIGQQGCCPSGNTCQVNGGKKLCIPQGNSCQCTPDKVGLTRSCFATAGTNTCVGQQACDSSGSFGMCDTSMTTVELCDGRDNDCNGRTDETFVNTRGTGTYDSDDHCGTCQTNCPAQWSPTVQHAIGGCVVNATPSKVACEIIRCTTDAIPAGAACRVDTDCSNQSVCHPTFHQCVHACTSSPCGTGERCVSGFCAQTCMTASDCASLNPAARCSATGTCEMPYQFVNADKEPTNGCECASAQGVVDVPDTAQQYPVPGLTYVDRNCDNVDGDAATSLFVWAQSTSSMGTRAAPFKTIAEALNAFVAGRHTAILVAQGTYLEQVVMKNGANLYGGYRADFAVRDVVGFPTFVEAAEPDASTGATIRRGTINAEGLNDPTFFAGFTVRGYDVISRTAPGTPARNTYGVYAKNSPGLRLFNNHIVGGRGGDAAPAGSGTAGANGGPGANGVNARECNTPDCTNETQGGSTAGVNASCPSGTAGNPGAGSDLQRNPQDYGSGTGSNLNGRGGANAQYAHSDPSQNAFCKYDCTVPSEGLAGGAARNGSDGSSVMAGRGCSASIGMIVGDDWVTPLGSLGGDGSVGRGGGGGGAGGCVNNANDATCTVGRRVGDLGATGGAGGAGGCGGARGAGAGGGGASFAVFIIGPAAMVRGNLIDLGFGGFGGSGGSGGYGGLGGPGGTGGTNTTVAWCAGQGGPGGRGGNGGAGSGGGAGCGGSVFGLAGPGPETALEGLVNTFAPLPMNAVGAGGTGGASPAGMSFKGGDGAPGSIATVQTF